MSTLTIHRAPWVVPISEPVLTDAAVAVQDGRIVDVGPFADLEKKYPGSPIAEHTGCAFLPPLVNAHIHLELSHIHIAEDTDPVAGFTDWIARLLAAREENGAIGAAVEQAARETLARQYELGVIAIGDIGNTDIGAKLAPEFPGMLLHFNEVLGRSRKTRKSILAKVAAAPGNKRFTAHAPYSTHAELIQFLKARALKLDHPFPIHTAEPPSENELLAAGTGELFTFLLQRGFVDNSFRPPAGIDNHGSVQYLHKLGVLDARTICVHCIHVGDAEISILAETGTRICLCPGSNRHLHVGRAPVKKFLAHGILPAIGTDSRASNPEISMWREMAILSRDHRDVAAEDILAMATAGGAKALGIDRDYGTLARGKKAKFLAIQVPYGMRTAEQLVQYLAADNAAIKPVWITE
ncbi:MAG: amidohydrolase family protein [Desulfobulbaceae bacterium]|nr:amidohydrolase family protein [Desulfobulbaceae bacterium]